MMCSVPGTTWTIRPGRVQSITPPARLWTVSKPFPARSRQLTYYSDPATTPSTWTAPTATAPDTITVGSTETGLHPDSLRRVDFIAGELHLNGGADLDTILVDDSGDDNANIGAYVGDAVTGLDMAGTVIFDAPDNLSIQLGAQDDTFYVPATNADLITTLNSGGGFDRVYIGTIAGSESQGSLNAIQGAFFIDGDGPEARDELYLNDQSDMAGQTFGISNELEPIVKLEDGRLWRFDTTTVERSNMANIFYRRIETVVVNAGQADDTINLRGTHREQDTLGGKNSTFTINAGSGDDTINLGDPVNGGYSLAGFGIETGLPTADGIRGIPVMINGQDGYDAVQFSDSASTVDTDMAFAKK